MNKCRMFLTATRMVAKREGRPTDAGAYVMGDAGLGYTVEFPNGKQVEVGRAHCKFCARVDAINQLESDE